jgi:hypothetical protein
MTLLLVILITIFFMLFIIKQKKTEQFKTITLQPKNISKNINFISKNINFIYTTINGIYKIFHGSNITLNNPNSKHSKIRELLNIDYVDSGFYNYKHNYLGILYKNNIHKYNLHRQQIDAIVNIKDFFKNIDTTISIKCLFYLANKIYIFSDKNIIIYDLSNEKIIKETETINIFEKIPDTIDCCFLNYNDVEEYSPIPYIYILKNKIYYKYKFITSENFKFIESKPFTFENKNKLIKTNTNFKVDKNGMFRITCIGGGNPSGGRGGIVFNDIKLKKNDILKINIGKSGTRIPVKENLFNKFNLPYTGSCSGSGGTSINKDNKVIMVAGGGGGWTSELIESPSICHSVNYFDTKKYKSNLFFPIKKIVIKTFKSKEVGTKIIVNKLDVKVKNTDEIIMDIYETPTASTLSKEYKELKKSKYKTAMSRIGENASIEIEFNKVLTEYTIELDYNVETSENVSQFNDSNVILFDEQNRKYTISNFNQTFGSSITSKKLFDYFSHNTLPTIKSNNEFVNNGNIKKNKFIKSNSIFYLDGGSGGEYNGGFATSNRYNKINSCGGGGGWKGGKGISVIDNLDISNIPLDYLGATGGKSFIDNLSIQNKELLYDQFINNFNDKDGYVIINKIN